MTKRNVQRGVLVQPIEVSGEIKRPCMMVTQDDIQVADPNPCRTSGRIVSPKIQPSRSITWFFLLSQFQTYVLLFQLVNKNLFCLLIFKLFLLQSSFTSCVGTKI